MLQKTTFLSSLRSVAQWCLLALPLGLFFGKAPLNVLCGIIVVLFLLHVVIARDWQIFNKPWIKWALAYWALQIASGLWAENASEASYAGLVWGRYLLFGIAAAYWLLNDAAIQKRFLCIMALYLAVLSADGILQHYTGHDVLGREKYNQYANKDGEGIVLPGDRLTGPFKQPIIASALLYFLFPVLLMVFSTAATLRARAVYGVAGLLAVYVIFIAGERAALLLMLLGLLIMFALLARRQHWKPLALAALMIVGMALAQVFWLDKAASGPQDYLEHRQLESTWKVIHDLPNSPYGLIWQDALKLISEHPLLGVGEMNIRVHWCDRNEMVYYTKGCPLHPHNIYLEVAANTGLIGLVLYLAVLVSVLRTVVNTRHYWIADALATGLVIALCVRFWPLVSVTSYMRAISSFSFWLIIGWTISRIDLLKRGAAK